MNPTALIVSPYFPPSTLAGVHRARHLANHLPAHGWRPIVVRTDERHYDEPGDPALAALAPTSVEQIRVGALPADICRLAGFGDIGLRSYVHLGRAISRLAAAERPSVVFITGSPFYPMLLARRIAKRLGLPVVLDFQDPWVSSDDVKRPAGSKAWLAHRLASALEPIAVRHASFITSVSQIQNEALAARYDSLDLGRMAAIPIGGDPSDYNTLGTSQASPRQVRLDPTKINFSYVGTLLPRAGPLIRQVFSALAQFRRQWPQLAATLRFNFVGTSNQPGASGPPKVIPYARNAGVEDMVNEWPARAPYLEALGILAGSHAILLIGSDEPHYTASKIYPALLSGRPYLALFHHQSSAHQILRGAGGGTTIAFDGLAEGDAAVPLLVDAIHALVTTPTGFGTVNHDAIEPFTARAVAGQFAAIFARLAGR